jgi:hypothetical protein
MAASLPGDHSCTCGHDNDTHVRRKGWCKGTDSDGLACECIGFEHSDTCIDFDDDVEDDERQKPHPYPDTHYRHLIDDNSRVDREEPE